MKLTTEACIFLSLLLVSAYVSGLAPEECKIVKYMSQFQTLPDGIIDEAYELENINMLCGASTSTQVTSLKIDIDYVDSCGSVYLTRKTRVDNLDFYLSYTISATCKMLGKSVNLNFHMTKQIRLTSITSSLNSVNSFWVGVLESEGCNTVGGFCVYDHHLFDGVRSVVMDAIAPFQQGEPNNVIRSMLTDSSDISHSNYKQVTSPLFAKDSVRGLFSTSINNGNFKVMKGRKYNGSIFVDGELWIAMVTTIPSSKQSFAYERMLREAIEVSSGKVDNVDLSTAFEETSISASIFHGSDHTYQLISVVNSIVKIAKLTIDTSQTLISFASIYKTTSKIPVISDNFLDQPTSYMHVIQSLTSTLKLYIFGAFHRNGQLYSSIGKDWMESNASGFIPDVIVQQDLSYLDKLKSTFLSIYSSGIDLFDDPLQQFLTRDESCVERLKSREVVFTLKKILSNCYPAVVPLYSFDGISAIITQPFTIASSTFQQNDVAFLKFKDSVKDLIELKSVGRKGMISVSFKFYNLLNPSDLKIDSSTQVSKAGTCKIGFTTLLASSKESTFIYNYGTEEFHIDSFKMNTMPFSTNELGEDMVGQSMILASYNYVSRLVSTDIISLSTKIPFVNHDFDTLSKGSIKEMILSLSPEFETSGKPINTAYLSRDINQRLYAFSEYDIIYPSVYPNGDSFVIIVKVYSLAKNIQLSLEPFTRSDSKYTDIISSVVKFSISSSSLSIIENTRQLNYKLNHLRLPFRYKFQSGIMKDSSLSINVNLPSYNIAISSNLIDVYLNLLTFSLKYDQNVNEPVISVKGPTTTLIASPVALSYLINIFKIPKTLLTGPLNIPIEFINKFIGNLQSWDTTKLEWLEKTVKSSDALFTIQTPNVGTTFTGFNIILNEYNNTCKFEEQFKDPDQFVKSLANALNLCGFNGIFTPSLNEKKNISLSSPVSPLIFRVHLKFFTTTKYSPVYTYFPRLEGIYSSWEDLLWILSSYLRYDFIEPRYLQIPTSSVIQEKFILDYLPKYLTGISIPITMKQNFQTNQQVIFNAKPSQNVALSLTGEAKTDFGIEFQTSFGMILTSPPYGNLTTFTNATEEISLDTIVTEGKNKMKMIFQYQVLEKGMDHLPPILEKEVNVELPIGRSIRDLLLYWLPHQLPEPINEMFSVGNIKSLPKSSMENNVQQLEMFFMRARSPDSTKYYTPFGITIIPDHIPCIPLIRNSLSRSQPFLSDLSLGAHLSYSPKITSASGSLGLFTLNLLDKPIVGSASIEFEIQQKQIYNFLDRNFFGNIADNNTLMDMLDISLTKNIDLNIAKPFIELSSIHLTSEPLDYIIFQTKKSWNNFTSSMYKEFQEKILEVDVFFNSTNQILIDAYTGLAKTNSTSLCKMMQTIVSKLQHSVTKLGDQKIPFTQTRVNDLLHNTITEKFLQISPNVCKTGIGMTVEIMCSKLQDVFGQQVCYNITMINDELKLNLELDKYVLNSRDSLLLQPDLFDSHSHELAPIIGSQEHMSIVSLGSFSLEIVTSLETLDVSISDNSFVKVDTSFSAGGNIQAEMGSLHMSLGQLDLDIFVSIKAIKTSSASSSAIDVDIQGNGHFYGVLGYGDKTLCSLDLNFPDLLKILKGEEKVQVTAGCGGLEGFKKSIQNLLEKTSLLEIFKNPGFFLSKWLKEMGGLKGIFKKLMEGFVVPLLDDKLAEILTGPLGEYTNSKISKEIIGGINSVILGILSNETLKYDSELVNQIVLDELTLLLCTILPVKKCPEPPSAKLDTYEWPLEFGSTLSNEINQLKFDLGKNNNVELKSTIGLECTLEYDFKFTLVFNKSHGLSLRFDDGEVFKAFAKLQVEKDSALSGRFAFVGAAAVLDTSSKFEASITISKSNHNWSFEPLINTNFNAFLEIGLVGLLKEIKDNSVVADLESYPHFEMSIELNWNFKKGTYNTSPQMKVMDPKVCLGTMLQKIALQIREKLDLFLGPLDKFFESPNGFLVRKIPTTDLVYGRLMNVAELAVYMARTRGAQAEGVEEAVRALNQIYKFYETLKKLEKLIDFDQCGIKSSTAKSWIFDFTQPEPTLVDLDMNVDTDPIFPPSFTEEQKHEFRITMDTMQEHDFAFHFTFLEDKKKIPMKILQFILGEDVELFRFDLPGMKFDFHSNHLRFLVFSPPPVFIDISFEAFIVLRLPPIAFTTRGLEGVIRNGDISSLYKGLCFINRNADGSPLPVIAGAISVIGEVDVGVILEGFGFLKFTVELDVILASVGYPGKLYLDELSHLSLLGAFDLRLWGYITYGVGVQLCTPDFLGRICKDIYRKSYGPDTLWDHTDKITPISPAVSSDGKVSTNYLTIYPPILPHRCGKGKGNDLVTYIISLNPKTMKPEVALKVNNRVQIPLLYSTSESNVIWFGDTPSVPYIMEVGTGPISIKDPTQSTNHFKIIKSDKQEWNNPIILNYNGLTTKTRSVAQVIGCISMEYQRVVGGNFLVNSIPCPVHLVNFEGTLIQLLKNDNNDFVKFGPVMVEGRENSLRVTIPTSNYEISSTKIIGNSAVYIESKDDIRKIDIDNSKQHSSESTIKKITTNTELSLKLGNGLGNVYVYMNDIYGVFNAYGGEGNCYMHMKIDNSDENTKVIMSGNSLIVNKKHLVSFTNFVEKIVNLQNSKTSSIVHFQSPQKISVVKYNIIHTSFDATTITNITQCETTHVIYVNGKGGGNVRVYIGQGSLKSVRCPIYVSAEENTSIFVEVDGSSDTNIPYEVKCVNSRCTIIDSRETIYEIVINFISVKRIVFKLPSHTKNNFIMIQGTVGTEVIASAPLGNAIICRNENENPILLNDFDAISFGPMQYVCYDSPDRINLFSNLLSPCYVNGQTRVSAPQTLDTDQHISFILNCMNSTNKDGSPITNIQHPAEDFIEMLPSTLRARNFCHLNLDTRVSAFIKTGLGVDSLVCKQISIQYLQVDLEEGGNYVLLEDSTATFNISTQGPYTADFTSPLILVEFYGKTTEARRGIINARVTRKTYLDNDILYDVSDLDHNSKIILHRSPFDILTILRKPDIIETIEFADIISSDMILSQEYCSDPVIFNLNIPFSNGRTQIDSDMCVRTDICAEGSTMVLYSDSQKNTAYTFNSNVANTCFLYIDTVKGTNQTVTITAQEQHSSTFNNYQLEMDTAFPEGSATATISGLTAHIKTTQVLIMMLQWGTIGNYHSTPSDCCILVEGSNKYLSNNVHNLNGPVRSNIAITNSLVQLNSDLARSSILTSNSTLFALNGSINANQVDGDFNLAESCLTNSNSIQSKLELCQAMEYLANSFGLNMKQTCDIHLAFNSKAYFKSIMENSSFTLTNVDQNSVFKLELERFRNINCYYSKKNLNVALFVESNMWLENFFLLKTTECNKIELYADFDSIQSNLYLKNISISIVNIGTSEDLLTYYQTNGSDVYIRPSHDYVPNITISECFIESWKLNMIHLSSTPKGYISSLSTSLMRASSSDTVKQIQFEQSFPINSHIEMTQLPNPFLEIIANDDMVITTARQINITSDDSKLSHLRLFNNYERNLTVEMFEKTIIYLRCILTTNVLLTEIVESSNVSLEIYGTLYGQKLFDFTQISHVNIHSMNVFDHIAFKNSITTISNSSFNGGTIIVIGNQSQIALSTLNRVTSLKGCFMATDIQRNDTNLIQPYFKHFIEENTGTLLSNVIKCDFFTTRISMVNVTTESDILLRDTLETVHLGITLTSPIGIEITENLEKSRLIVKDSIIWLDNQWINSRTESLYLFLNFVSNISVSIQEFNQNITINNDPFIVLETEKHKISLGADCKIIQLDVQAVVSTILFNASTFFSNNNLDKYNITIIVQRHSIQAMSLDCKFSLTFQNDYLATLVLDLKSFSKVMLVFEEVSDFYGSVTVIGKPYYTLIRDENVKIINIMNEIIQMDTSILKIENELNQVEAKNLLALRVENNSSPLIIQGNASISEGDLYSIREPILLDNFKIISSDGKVGNVILTTEQVESITIFSENYMQVTGKKVIIPKYNDTVQLSELFVEIALNNYGIDLHHSLNYTYLVLGPHILIQASKEVLLEEPNIENVNIDSPNVLLSVHSEVQSIEIIQKGIECNITNLIFTQSSIFSILRSMSPNLTIVGYESSLIVYKILNTTSNISTTTGSIFLNYHQTNNVLNLFTNSSLFRRGLTFANATFEVSSESAVTFLDISTNRDMSITFDDNSIQLIDYIQILWNSNSTLESSFYLMEQSNCNLYINNNSIDEIKSPKVYESSNSVLSLKFPKGCSVLFVNSDVSFKKVYPAELMIEKRNSSINTCINPSEQCIEQYVSGDIDQLGSKPCQDQSTCSKVVANVFTEKNYNCENFANISILSSSFNSSNNIHQMQILNENIVMHVLSLILSFILLCFGIIDNYPSNALALTSLTNHYPDKFTVEGRALVIQSRKLLMLGTGWDCELGISVQSIVLWVVFAVTCLIILVLTILLFGRKKKPISLWVNTAIQKIAISCGFGAMLVFSPFVYLEARVISEIYLFSIPLILHTLVFLLFWLVLYYSEERKKRVVTFFICWCCWIVIIIVQPFALNATIYLRVFRFIIQVSTLVIYLFRSIVSAYCANSKVKLVKKIILFSIVVILSLLSCVFDCLIASFYNIELFWRLSNYFAFTSSLVSLLLLFNCKKPRPNENDNAQVEEKPLLELPKQPTE